MSFKPDGTVPVLLLPDGGWTVLGHRQYVGNPEHGGDVVDIPAGFRTDFGSVPWVLRALLPTIGRVGLAFLVHDVGCEARNRWHKEVRRLAMMSAAAHDGGQPCRLCWQEAEAAVPAVLDPVSVDGMFRRILGELGEFDVVRWLYWTGVRWGALFNPARRAGWWRTAPQVVGISVLAAPVIVPVAVVTALAGAVLWLAEGFHIMWTELWRG